MTGLLGLVGCGGGGGGGGNSAAGRVGADLGRSLVNPDLPPEAPPAARPLVNISVANAFNVAGTVLQASNHLSELTLVLAAQLIPPLPSAPDTFGSNSKVALMELADITGSPAAGNCLAGGSVTVADGHFVGTGNHPAGIAEGNLYDLTFVECDDGDGFSLNGTLSIQIQALTGDLRSDVFELGYFANDIDLTISSGSDSHEVRSDFRFDFNSLSFPALALTNRPWAVLATQTDSYEWSFGGQALHSVAGGVSSIVATEDKRSSISSELLGGYLQYETLTPLQGAQDQPPVTGEVLVVDEGDGGTVRIVVESETQVRLETDADGNGIIDDVRFTTWGQLMGTLAGDPP
jgi:hypothetical protein